MKITYSVHTKDIPNKMEEIYFIEPMERSSICGSSLLICVPEVGVMVDGGPLPGLIKFDGFGDTLGFVVGFTDGNCDGGELFL